MRAGHLHPGPSGRPVAALARALGRAARGRPGPGGPASPEGRRGRGHGALSQLRPGLAVVVAITVTASVLGAVETVEAVPASASEVGTPSVSVSPAKAGSVSTWTVSFVAKTALAGGSGTVTLAVGGEPGTVMPATASDYVVTDLTNASGSGTVTAAPALSDASSQVTVVLPASTSAKDKLKLAISGVTDPPAPTSVETVTVETSGDTTPATSAAFSIKASADGSGKVAVSPTSVLASVPCTLQFTYTAAAGGVDGGTLSLAVPPGWSAPTLSPGQPGHVATVGRHSY